MAAGEAGPCWFMARTQSAGRGRRGRIWYSRPGNLYASLLLPPNCATAAVSGLSLLAALAVHDAVSMLAGAKRIQAELKLKWPNDLLLGDKKLAGILLETVSAQSSIDKVVIGCGVNIAHCPQIREKPATCLEDHDVQGTVDDLLSHLAAAFEKRLSEWSHGHNFAAIRKAWLERARGLGKIMAVEHRGVKLSGIFETIDSGGALVLRLDDGTRQHISSGEISLAGS